MLTLQWPWGNTTDTALIRQVKADLRDWTLARIIWVGDRGFTSAANRRDLRAGGHGYILGEKLHSGSADAAAALARPGRYRTAADNLQVKEVKMGEDERFVVCVNPEAAERDAAPRQVMLDKLTERKRAELAGRSPPCRRCAATCAPHPPGCSAWTRPRSPPGPDWTASTCCAAPTPPSAPRTSPWATSNCSRSNAAGGT
jgi:hypothetical protein